jgi:excinuclease UvrABC ATPase subunit
MLRILFSRLGQPRIGSPSAFSFNVPSVRASGAIMVERGAGKTVRQTFSRTGGMCPRCEGRGTVSDLDLTQLFDESKSLAEGAITIPGYQAGGWNFRLYSASGLVDPHKPIRDYTGTELHDFLHHEPVRRKIEGINMTYEGLIPRVRKSLLAKDRESMRPHIRAFVDRAVTFTDCPECAGTRLSEAARSSRIHGVNIADASAMQISDLAAWLGGLDEPSVAPLLEHRLGGRDISEVLAMTVAEAEAFFGAGQARTPAAHTVLGRLAGVGLGYLRLGQPLTALSGGERQRLKLATRMADKGEVYVLDEPTAGLHLADIQRLLGLLDQLADSGKSVIVVEHHPAVMAHADWIVDLGPGAGHDGGRIVFEGTPAELVAARSTITGEHLAAYVEA